MNFKKSLYLSLNCLLLLMFVGCASNMIETRPGAETVDLQSASNVASCLSKGRVTVSVLAQVGFYTRSADVIESNLLQMARNSAIDGGADTVVKEDMPEYGRRTFALYKCRR